MSLGQNGDVQIRVFMLDLHSLHMMSNSSAEGTNELATATETVRADLSNGAQHHGGGKDNL